MTIELTPVSIWLVVAVMGLLVASVINAIWLRLARSWLGIGEFGYEKPFGTAVLSTFVFAALWAPMVLGLWSGIREDTYGSGNLVFLFAPADVFYFHTGSILVHALIFSQRLADKDGTPLPFGKASALAVVYMGICTAFYILAGLLLSWLLAVTRWA